MKKSIGTLLAVMLIATTADAQFGRRFGREPTYFESQVEIAGLGAVVKKLEKAEKDVANGEFDRAVQTIQDVLDRHFAGAYVTGEGEFVGVRDHCNAFLAKLPEAGLEAYRKTFDPRAKNLFDRGVREHAPEALRPIYVRYLMTSYGRRAMKLAVEIHLERGELYDASTLALLFLDTFPDDAARASIYASLALSWRGLGERDRITELARSLDAETLKTPIRFGESQATLGRFIEDTAADIETKVAIEPTPYTSRVLKTPRWTADIVLADRGRSQPYGTVDDFQSRVSASRFIWNPVRPVIDDSAVYLNTGLGIRAVGLYTGAAKWPEVKGPVEHSQARRNIAIDFPITLADGMIYAPLETPVKREMKVWNYTPEFAVPHRQLYAVDASTGKVAWKHYYFDGKDRAESEFISGLNVNSAPLAIGDRLYVAATRFHTNFHHYVCCFDRMTGNLLWSTFVLTGQMEQNMFGNPVRESRPTELIERDGILYYSTNIGAVAAVDTRLGTLVFASEYRQIPIPRKMRFDGSILERAPGWRPQAPFFHGENVIVAPIDSPDLIAVHRRSGRVRVIATRDRSNRFRYHGGPYKNVLAVCGIQVAFYDLGSFELLAKTNIGQERSGAGEGIAGTPVVVGNRLYAMARSFGEDKMLVWDLDRLKLVEAVSADVSARDRITQLGNLTFNGDVMAAAAVDRRMNRPQVRVRCFFDEETVVRKIREAVERHPRDPRLHLTAGELALQRKDYKSALERFRDAFELAAKAPVLHKNAGRRAKQALFRLHVTLADESVSTLRGLELDRLECYEEAFRFAADRDHKIRMLFEVLAHHANEKSWEGVSTTADRIEMLFGDEPYDHVAEFQKVAPELPVRTRFSHAGMVATLVAAVTAERLEQPEFAVRCLQRLIAQYAGDVLGEKTVWRFAYERIGALLEVHGRDLYVTEEKQADALFRQAQETGSTPELRRILDVYPNSTRVKDAYAEMARGHVETREPTAAVRVIHEYFWRFDDVTPAMLDLLQSSLQAAGAAEARAEVLRYANLVATPIDMIETGDAPVALADWASRELKSLPKKRVGAPRPPAYGFEFNEAWRIGKTGHSTRWTLVNPGGNEPTSMAGQFLVHRDTELQCLSLEDGTTRWSIPVQTTPWREIHWTDGRLVGLLDGDLVVVDPSSGKELWRRRAAPAEEMVAITSSHGKVFCVVRPTTSELSFRLRAASLLDGETVSEASYPGIPYDRIYASDRWVMVPVEYQPRSIVVDALTGRAAPGMKSGLPYAEILPPTLSSAGMVVGIGKVDRASTMRLEATDPATGRKRWSRPLGRGRPKFWHFGDDALVYEMPDPAKAGRVSLEVIDLLTGTARLSKAFDNGTRIRDTIALTPTDIYISTRRSYRVKNRYRSSLHVEAISLKTRSSPWKTGNLTGTSSTSIAPFQGGVLLRLSESKLAGRGQRRRLYVSTLVTIDQRTGRMKSDLELEDRRSTRIDATMLLKGGRAIIVDGPMLKVFKP